MSNGLLSDVLARNWGWIVMRGLVAILFGILAFAMPGITLAVLVLVWGVYALADGIAAIMAGFKIKAWPLIVVGIIGLAAGIATFLYPGITALVLLTFIAGWAFVTGIFQILAAIRFRKVIQNELMLALSGILSVAFGVIMFARPGAGALAVIWIIAWYALLTGVLQLMLGFRMKGLSHRLAAKPATA
jgi:uncharacterized membrane protein HdeD (DUF308 family)